MAEFCQQCSAMFTPDGLERLYSTTGYTSHGTVEDVKNGVKNGCPLCKMLTDSDFAHPRWKGLKSWEKEKNHPYDYMLENHPDGLIQITGHKDTRSGNLVMLILNIGRRRGFSSEGNSDRHVDWDAVLALKISIQSGKFSSTSGLRTMRLDTELALNQARDWIKTCSLGHSNCHPSKRMVPLPSRVLDISRGVDNLRLSETSSMMGEYVALSYCWGVQQTGITVQSNVRDRMEKFYTQQLSLTVKDAVKVTEALGFHYLWIDALCIIQDSASDKIQEIGKMNQYYKNSSITIMASASKSAQDGFLSPVNYRFCHSPISLPNGKEATAIISHPLVVDEENETARLREDWYAGKWKLNNILRNLNTENIVDPQAFEVKVSMPIESRGWTLQEKLLSSRKLRYGVTQVDWRCKSGYASFSTLSPGNTCETITANRTEEKHPADFDFFGGKDYKPSTETLLSSWWSIVSDYSDRSLGSLSDKLLAIGGVAHEFHRVSGDTYIAGLWQSSLLKDLTWRAGDEDDMEYIMKKPDRLRSFVYRAPSWSWASIDGRINMDQSVGDFVPVAVLHDYNVELESDGNPFGGVTSGWLDIEAPLKILPSMGEDGLEFKKRLPADEDSEDGLYSFDISYDRKCRDSELGLLYLWRHDTKNVNPNDGEVQDTRKLPALAVGVMISRLVFYKEYRRVGMFIVDSGFFDEVPRKRVRIV